MDKMGFKIKDIDHYYGDKECFEIGERETLL